MKENTNLIAEIAFTAMLAVEKTIGRHPDNINWDTVDEEVRKDVKRGTTFRMINEFGTTSDYHEDWVAAMKEKGWSFGATFNEEKKFHPLMVDDYNDLPVVIRIKDQIFKDLAVRLKDRDI